MNKTKKRKKIYDDSFQSSLKLREKPSLLNNSGAIFSDWDIIKRGCLWCIDKLLF